MDIRLFWLALGSFAIGVEAFVITALLPAIASETGVLLVDASTLILAFSAAYALGSPVLAALTGALDRRMVLTASALVFTGGALVAGTAAGYGVLMGARVVMALAAGLYAATGQATAVGLSEPHHRARAISIIVGGTTLAVAFGAPLGALVASWAGWRGTYLGIAGLGLVAALAIWLMIPKGLRGVRLGLKERLSVVAVPGVLPALLTMLLYMTGAFTVFVYIAPLATDAVGLDKSLIPAVLLAMGVGAAIGNLLGGQMADRFGAQRTVVMTFAANVVLLSVASLVPHLPAGVAGPAFFAYMFIWGVLAWAFPPAQASRILAIAPGNAPLVLSLNASALYAGIAMGSVVGSQVMRHFGPMDLGLAGAVFPLLGLVLLLASQARRMAGEAAPRLG